MSDNTKQLYKKSSNGSYPKIFPLAFVQGIKDKRNDKELLSYINEINHFKVDYNENPETTRCQVNNFIRKKGLYITYYNTDTNESVTEYFKGNQSDVTDDNIWGNDDNWELVPDKQYIESHAVIPNKSITMNKLADDVVQAIGDSGLSADEEDLTDRNSTLKFKDREYNVEEASGLGYKILRKNWVEDKNILTQDMINETNTIYEIKYDFDLNEEEIIIPENCVLKFEGGSLSNGILNCKNTKFNSIGGKIFNTDLIIQGHISSPLYLSYFGIAGENPDNASIWKSIVFNSSGDNNYLELDSDVTFTEGDIQLPMRVRLNGNNHSIRFNNISSVSHGLIILGYRGRIYDVSIWAPQGYDGSIIVANTNVADVQNFFLNNVTIDGGYLSNQDYQCVGIDIYTDNSSVVSGHMTGWFVNNINIWWVKIGIRINGVNYNKTNENDFCWMNSMFFNNIYITGSDHGIDIGFTDNGISNPSKATGYFYFNNIEYQPKTYSDIQCMFVQHGNYAAASYQTFISNSINWDCPLLGRVVSGKVYINNVTNVGEFDDNISGTDAYGDYDTVYRMVRVYSAGRFFQDYALASELNIASFDYTKASGTQKYRISPRGFALDIRRQNNGMTHYIKRADESAFSIDNYRATNNFGFLRSDDSTPTQYYQWLSKNPGRSNYRILDFIRQYPVLETPGDLVWIDSYDNKEVYGLKFTISLVAGSSAEFKAVLKFIDSNNNLVNYNTYSGSAICAIDLPRSFSKVWSQKFDVYNVHYAIENNELVLYFTIKALESISGTNYVWFEVAYVKTVASTNINTADDGFLYVERSKTDFLQNATVTHLGTIVPANTTANRPTYSGLPVGYMYFDTTLGKPIYVKSINNNVIVWVDANGQIV